MQFMEFSHLRAVDLYDPVHPHIARATTCKVDLLEAAFGVLSSSGEMYDPERYGMYVSPEETFRYHVSMGLWDMALPPSIIERHARCQL